MSIGHSLGMENILVGRSVYYLNHISNVQESAGLPSSDVLPILLQHSTHLVVHENQASAKGCGISHLW